MTAQSAIPRFNALAAYEAEREVNRRLFELLGSVLFVADGLVSKLERQGEDVETARAIFAKARRERFS